MLLFFVMMSKFTKRANHIVRRTKPHFKKALLLKKSLAPILCRVATRAAMVKIIYLGLYQSVH